MLGGLPPLAQQQSRLKEEELLEDEPPLRVGAAGMERLEVGRRRREVREDESLPARWQPLPLPHRGRQRIGQFRRQIGEHPEHEPALQPRRHRPDLLVDRHDPARVHRVLALVAVVAQDLVLGIGELETAPELDRTVQHDSLRRPKHVTEERLIRKDRANRAARVANHELEQPEAGTPRRPHARGQHLARHSGHLTRAQARRRHEPPSVLVPQRKPQQQVLDRHESRPLEVRGTPRAHASQILQGRREQLGGHDAGAFDRGNPIA